VRSLQRPLILFLWCIISLPAAGTTWFVRPDGGTRYSSKAPKGQCDGAADKAYPGHGTNQHCAFNDVRYLWTDGTYTTTATQASFPSYGWIGNGGDTYIIRGGPWRVGQNGPNAKDGFGLAGNPYDAGAPAPLSGTPEHHTRILGENYANCSASNKTQLFGGYGVGAVLNLSAAYVDVQCLDLTRHSDCIRMGVPADPSNCRTGFPLDDYATNGIVTDTHTHDVLLQDLWIHGFTSRGIIGPIGGLVTARRVIIAYNGGAGWDFDDGKSTPMIHAVLNLDHVTVEWNGCNQMYPGTGAVSCYGQSSGGYGDGVGTPDHTCITAHVDHSIFRYNTQDGFDFLHNDSGNCSLSIENSTAYGNNGAQFKWGSHDQPVIFNNNTVVGNCRRLSAPMDHQPTSYNRNLGDFCRAEDAIAFDMKNGATVTFTNNSIVSYSPTTIDIGCDGSNCSSATLIFRNNIVLGYDNRTTYKDGGQPGGPGGFYFAHPIGHILRSDNIFFGLRNLKCVTSEKCTDPHFVREPRFSREQDLDHFDFRLSSRSPLQVGAKVP
jgi:hypothetical protein